MRWTKTSTEKLTQVARDSSLWVNAMDIHALQPLEQFVAARTAWRHPVAYACNRTSGAACSVGDS